MSGQADRNHLPASTREQFALLTHARIVGDYREADDANTVWHPLMVNLSLYAP